MPNIATAFKAEITRLARKESRDSTEGLKKANAAHRAEIARLKTRVQALEAEVKRIAKFVAKTAAQSQPSEPSPADGQAGAELRFRAKGMAANRKRLGLSAADFGLLVGATGQSVYAWEAGKSKPRSDSLLAIAALRGVGKREVEAKLASLKSAKG